MKPKLTKAQLAKAKRVVVCEFRWILKVGRTLGGGPWIEREDAEYAEVERLLRVALKAVRST